MSDVNQRAAEIGAAVKDADEKRRADAEGAGDMSKVLAALEGISQRMDSLEASAKARDDAAATPAAMPVMDGSETMTRSDYKNALARAQCRADEVASARCERAPPPMMSERVGAYRRRLLRPLQPDCKEFAAIDLDTISGPVFDAIETRILADAKAAAANPWVPEGDLIERKTVDESGRPISSFYGQPSAWMDQFKSRPQRARFIHNNRSNF